MNLDQEIQFSKEDILKEIDLLKKQIDDMRPLPPDVEGKVMQKLRLDWNYNSNAIEGNKLDYGETVAFLMTGITAKGKPLKDHLDIRGHNDAILFLMSILNDDRPLSEVDIKALHEMILVEPYDVKAQTADGVETTKRIELGKYKSLPNHVLTATGEIHYYSTPEETPIKMKELLNWYNEGSTDADIHPVVLAAFFHHKFASIHPFDDGNGRLSRILMNLILMRNNFPPVVIKKSDKENYYALLNRADVGDVWPFIEYIGERLQSSLKLYLKAANGGDIDEDEDVDKEIALLKMQLTGGITAKEKRSKDIVERVFFEEILPAFVKIEEKSKNFNEFFFRTLSLLSYDYSENRQHRVANTKLDEIQIKQFKFFEKDSLSIQMRIDYLEYKNPENTFDLSIVIYPEFDEFYYKIFIGSELIISKLYHEKLSPIDVSKIAKYFIQEFKNQLNQNQKGSES